MLIAITLSAPCGAAAAELTPILERIHWGDSADEIARRFGPRAMRLAAPIEFGDSFVDVALRDQKLGGYDFVVYFQMDKTTRRLKRVMLERPRHGVNPGVFRAVLAALERDYGPPAQDCTTSTAPRNGYQAAGERDWSVDAFHIRAVFRDTTIEAGEGCTTASDGACGLTGQLFLQITPQDEAGPPCR
jgi:hypothetical protein